MNTSFEEKSVWVQLISVVLSLGLYFVVAGRLLASGVDALPVYVPIFVIAVILIVLVNVVGHIVAAMVDPSARRDERDKLIGWRAESNSSWLLAVGVILAICCLILSVRPVWVAHLLLFALFASEVVKFTLQILYYRRGV